MANRPKKQYNIENHPRVSCWTFDAQLFTFELSELHFGRVCVCFASHTAGLLIVSHFGVVMIHSVFATWIQSLRRINMDCFWFPCDDMLIVRPWIIHRCSRRRYEILYSDYAFDHQPWNVHVGRFLLANCEHVRIQTWPFQTKCGIWQNFTLVKEDKWRYDILFLSEFDSGLRFPEEVERRKSINSETTENFRSSHIRLWNCYICFSSSSPFTCLCHIRLFNVLFEVWYLTAGAAERWFSVGEPNDWESFAVGLNTSYKYASVWKKDMEEFLNCNGSRNAIY